MVRGITTLPPRVVGELQADLVQPAVVRSPVGVDTTDPSLRPTLAQADAPLPGPLDAPRVGRLSLGQPGLTLSTQAGLRRAFDSLGADPSTRDALVARLAALPWGDTLSFDRTDSESILRALPRMHDILKAGLKVDSGENSLTLRDVAANGNANCFGSSQVFLALADALGLHARSIQVSETTSGRGTLHVASMVDLPDGRQVTVDLLYRDAVSQPFKLDEAYRRDGNVLRLNEALAGQHYAAIRPLSLAQLRTFVDSQSPPPLDLRATSAERGALTVAHARTAIGADPGNPWLYATLADGLEVARPGRFDDTPRPEDFSNLREQEAALRRATELSPSFEEFYMQLGRVQDKLGEHGAAVATRRRVLEVLEADFIPRLRAASGLGASASLSELLASPAAASRDLGYLVETLISARIDLGVSLGRTGDRATARAYLEETRRLASMPPGSTNWFDYYSGQSYIDKFQGP